MTNCAKKVLVVGGAGYVGCVLVSELLQRGYAVKVFDRLYYGAHGLRGLGDRVELVVGDVRAMPPEVLEDTSAVINLSGLSNDPTAEYNPKANYEMNTVATEQLALACKKAGVSRFVFASTCSVYDFGDQAEENDRLLDETAEVRPQAAYASSKLQAERALLALADDDFCPVLLRKGTVFGFSPRMRYDLVVNTFVKSSLCEGGMTLHNGGEIWRPLVEVRDVAKAHVACLQAPSEKVHGQIFNLVQGNFRVSEVALKVREALRELGIDADIWTERQHKAVRNYRVSGKKMERVLNFRPTIGIEESAKDLVEKIREYEYGDFGHPRYYNIQWMQLLEEAHACIKITGSVFGAPAPRAVGVATARAAA